MDSKMDLIINLMKEVECNEKAAKEAIEETANSCLDIFAKVDELKLVQQRAKEMNDKHAREVCAQKAVLATEIKELQIRVSGVLNEGGKSLGVLDELRESLEKRLISASRTKVIAKTRRLRKELLARKALAYEENQIKKVVQESERLKKEAIKNFELKQLLAYRGHIVDVLDKEISNRCMDVNLLKKSLIDQTVLSPSQTSTLETSETPSDEPYMETTESNKTANGCTDEHVHFASRKLIKRGNVPENELLPKISYFDMKKVKRNEKELSEIDIKNAHVVADIAQMTVFSAGRVEMGSTVKKDFRKKKQKEKRN